MYDIMDFYKIKVAQGMGNYDIIHDIMVFTMISCMISYMILSKYLWYHVIYVISYFFVYNIIHDIIQYIMYEIIIKVLYHRFCMISYYSYMKVDIILSCMISCKISYMISYIYLNPNHHGVCCSSLAAANLPPAQRSDARKVAINQT